MTSRDLNNWMWSEALSLLDEAERLQRQFFRLGRGMQAAVDKAGSQALAPGWEPPVDVIETSDAVRVHVALPGVAVDDIEVGLQPGALIVSALRAFPAPEHGARIHRVEIPYGRFERRIALPTHALEPAAQVLSDGCLVLTFRKKEIA